MNRKSRLYSGSRAAIFFIFSTLSIHAFSTTVETSVSNESTNQQYSLNVDELTPEQLEDLNHWQSIYSDNEFVLISNSDINTPILTKHAELSSNHPLHGSVTISNGEMSSAVFVPAASAKPRSAETNEEIRTFSVRPTLFVSIPGWHGSIKPGVSVIEPWQRDELRTKISEMTQLGNNHFSEIKYMVVKWQSARSNKRQVKEAGKAIRSWLRKRTLEWDVVLIGHSRGGIFAHDLSEELKSGANINTLHTILLDPTAAIGWADSYPSKLQTSSSHQSYGSLYYDDDGYIDDDENHVSSGISTKGDMKISGYNNYGRNDHKYDFDHSNYASKWVKAELATGWGFDKFLDDLWAYKGNGTFAADGDVDNYTILDVGIDEEIYLDIETGKEDGNYYLIGELGIGPVTSNVNLLVGDNGLATSYNVGSGIAFVSSAIVVNKTRADVEIGNTAYSMSNSLSEDEGLKSTHNFLGKAEIDVAINKDGVEINMQVLGENVNGASTIKEAGDDFVDSVGDAIRKPFKNCCKVSKPW